MNYQYRKKHLNKQKLRKKQQGCPYCNHVKNEAAVYEDDYLFIVQNLSKYDIWELHDVHEHLLVVPKRHLESLQDFTDAEKLALMNVITDYESQGYSIYARGVGFARKTVAHQHTHLIKADNKEAKFSLFIKKPYILIKK